MNNFYYFLFGCFAVLGIGVIFLTIWLIKKHREKIKLRLSLNYSLLLIEFPRPITLQQTQTDLRIKIAEELTTFENFLANLSKIKSPIAFEVSVPHYGEEIYFYIAVPKKEVDFLRKTVLGFWPGAEISLIKEDYNVFNPTGFSIASIVKLKNHFYLPIRSYKELAQSNVDPLDSFLSAFNKLSKEGEGLAWQIILVPAPAKENRKILNKVKKLREGEKLSEVLGKSIVSEIMKTLSEFFVLKPETKKKKEEEEKMKPKPVEEIAIKNLEFKANKPLFKLNIRLVASANDEITADQILSALESPFHQFTNPGFNEFYYFRPKGRYLKKVFYQFAFRLFDESQSFLLNTEEITSIFHFPSSYIKNPIIHWLSARSAPPPSNLPNQGIILGENVYQGMKTTVRITREDRRRHIYVIGQTGTGKTTLLKNMVTQDIKNGDGVCFIDPHGDVAQEILGLIPKERIEDVIYFNPGDTRRPIGLNVLEYSPERPEEKTFIINTLIEIIDKLYNLQVTGGPMFEQYLRNALLLLMDDPSWGYTLLEVSKVFVDESFRDELLSKCKNYPVIEFWTKQAPVVGGELSLENMITWVTSKLNPFITNDFVRPIIAQSKSTIDFNQIMNERKILIINLSKGLIGETSAYLMGMLLITKILLGAFARITIPEEERKDFYLYIDEFQNFAFKGVASILAEARKYRLSMVLAHQYIKQLPEEIASAVVGNVGTIISFRIGAQDAEFLERIFLPVFNKFDLVNIPNYNAYIKLLVYGYVSDAFNIKTFPPEPSSKELAEKISELSMLKYGKDKAEIEKEIAEKYANLI
jgi:GTPase SAR1 family protein